MRQRLVLAVMREVRPDIVMRTRNEGDPKLRAELTQKLCRTPQSGYWGEENEWKYFIHGIGCRLTHTITEELIDWDSGDLRRFDRHSFLLHLEWRLVSEANDEKLSDLRKVLRNSRDSLEQYVYPALDRLVNQGILGEPDDHYRYVFLTIDEPPEHQR